MTKAELETIVARHGLYVDGTRQGAGKFRDLEIGVGADPQALADLQAELADEGIGCRTVLTHVANHQHPQYGQPYLQVHSFWDETAATVKARLARGD